MRTEWTELWCTAADLPVGDASFAPKLRGHLATARHSDLRGAADRGLALCHAGHALGALPIAWYGALCVDRGEPFPARFHRALVDAVRLLEARGWAPEAGRAMRALPEQTWAQLERRPYPPVLAIGHAGGPARTKFLLDLVASWPRGAYTHLKKAATRARRRAELERHWGYSAKELRAHFVEAISALGVEALDSIGAVQSSGTEHDDLLFEAVGRVGSPAAASIVATGLSRPKKAQRKDATAGLQALAPELRSLAIDAAKAQAKGAAKRDLDALAPAPVTDAVEARAVERLLETHGEAWREMGVSGETLVHVTRWWVTHIASDNWYANRPAYEAALAAHHDLPEAVEVACRALVEIERHGSGTLGKLRAGLGRARVDAHVGELLGEGKLAKGVAEQLLRAFRHDGQLGPEQAFGAAGTTTAEGRGHALAILLRSPEPSTAVLSALSSGDATQRRLAARVAEVRGLRECLPALLAAMENEQKKAVRLTQARAVAILSLGKTATPDELDTALAALPRGSRRHLPAPEVLPDLIWADGVTVSADARAGLLEVLAHESDIAASPLAHLSARSLDPHAASGWGEALFIEKPTMTKKAHAFRARASVVLLSEDLLLAWAKRYRRRTASAFHAELGILLARRDTEAAREASRWFPSRPV